MINISLFYLNNFHKSLIERFSFLFDKCFQFRFTSLWNRRWCSCSWIWPNSSTCCLSRFFNKRNRFNVCRISLFPIRTFKLIFLLSFKHIFVSLDLFFLHLFIIIQSLIDLRFKVLISHRNLLLILRRIATLNRLQRTWIQYNYCETNSKHKSENT